MDLYFLVTLGLGMLTAVVVIAHLVTYIHRSFPVALFSFFTGLIAATALVLYCELPLWSPAHAVAGISGFLLAYLVSGGLVALPVTGYLTVFLAGSIAISAMILPGVSGSLFLLLLGKYVYLSAELSSLVASIGQLVNGGSTADVIDPATTILVFVLGGLVGLLTLARVIRAALARNREVTLVFLVSLIAGSVRAPLIRVNEHVAVWSIESIGTVSVWVILGAVALLTLDILAGGFTPE